MRIPRQNKFIKTVEIKKPDSNCLINCSSSASQGKIYTAMGDLLQGSIVGINGENPTPSLIRKIPLISAEYIAGQALSLIRGVELKIETISNCPLCFEPNKREENNDSDNRLSLKDFKVNFTDDADDYYLEIDDEVVIPGGGVFNKYWFRDPMLEDFIQIQNDHTLKDPFKGIKKINLMCLTNIEGAIEDPTLEFEELKKRYGYELLAFPDFSEYNKIQRLMRTYGYDPRYDEVCGSCRKQYRPIAEFTNFFAYALRSMLQGKAI